MTQLEFHGKRREFRKENKKKKTLDRHFSALRFLNDPPQREKENEKTKIMIHKKMATKVSICSQTLLNVELKTKREKAKNRRVMTHARFRHGQSIYY